MRILHTSDWHLGRSFHGEGLSDAHARYFDHLVELAASEKVDAVLVAGDIYDRALPSPASVALLDDVLVRLLETGTHVVLTSGNHDSATRLGFGSRVMERAGLSIRTALSSLDSPIEIMDRRTRDVAGYVVGIPYLEPRVAAPFLSVEATHAAVLEAAATRGMAGLPTLDKPVIAMAHAFFAGATTSDSERDIRVGGLGVAPRAIMDRFDYAALGHLHGAQSLSDSVRYSGSPLAMSFSEHAQRKGTWLIDIEKGTKKGIETSIAKGVGTGCIHATFIDAPAERKLALLRGTLEGLLADPDLSDAESAWCQVTLTDVIRPAGAMDRLRTRFPYTLNLMFDSPAQSGTQASYAERVRGRADVDLCCDFLEHVRGGRTADEQEHALVDQAVAASLHSPEATEMGGAA